MKKTKSFDAVQFQREARQKLAEEMKSMTFEQQKEYLKKATKEALGVEGKAGTAPNSR